MNKYNSSELYHYGVLGMKWGRRKKSYNTSEDSRRVQKIRKKHVSEMSNQELSDVNKRLQLESNYRNLKTQSNTGKKVLTTVIAAGITIGGIKTAVDNFGWAKDVTQSAARKIGNVILHK